MAKKSKKKTTTKTKIIRAKRKPRTIKKPVLIVCGNHYINPEDVSRIQKVQKGGVDIYSVKFRSEPNPNFACWVIGDDIGKLLERFEIITTDSKGENIPEDGEDDFTNW